MNFLLFDLKNHCIYEAFGAENIMKYIICINGEGDKLYCQFFCNTNTCFKLPDFVPPFLSEVDNFCHLLFASLHEESFPKGIPFMKAI